MNDSYVGWDVGGAHLKVARLADGMSSPSVHQLPCPLWRGMSNLRQALAKAQRFTDSRCAKHAVTMSGELADCFPDRSAGVRAILSCLYQQLGKEYVAYSCRSGLLARVEAAKRPWEVASANWHATASVLAGKLFSGVLVDIGSTTTDLVPFAHGRVMSKANNDYQRLTCGELLYSGVVRTNLLSLAQSCIFTGVRVPLVAEIFATTADVWRILGDLPTGGDLFPACDGASKTKSGSARRLARMLGRDYDGDFLKWRKVAVFFACVQTHRIKRAISALCVRFSISDGAPLVGAGSGRFLVRRIALETGRPYRDFSECLTSDGLSGRKVSEHASAVAMAVLLRDQFV